MAQTMSDQSGLEIDIEALLPGLETDELVSKVVFNSSEPLRHYSTRLRDAMSLLYKYPVNKSGNYGVPDYYCIIQHGLGAYRAEGKTYAMAICKAALKAVIGNYHLTV